MYLKLHAIMLILSVSNDLARALTNLGKKGMFVFKNSSIQVSKQRVFIPTDELPLHMENEESRDEENIFFIQGDIIVSKDELINERKKRRIIKSSENGFSTRWPNGIVPYEFDHDTNDVIRNNALSAMNHWQHHTCLKFEPYSRVKHSNHNAKILIQNRGNCAARVGYSYDSRSRSISQSDVYLPSHCPFGTAVHEFGHVIGFRHEHTRVDRDEHVRVNYEKLQFTQKDQYSIMSNSEMGYYSVYYDLFSIMHYSNQGGFLESRDEKRSFLMGQRIGLSFSDIKMANLAYNCSGHCQQQFRCENDGFLSSNCTCICPDGLKGLTCNEIDNKQPTIQANQQQSKYPKLNCSFEFDFCDWIQDTSRDSDDWIRNTTFLKNYLFNNLLPKTDSLLDKKSFIQLNLIDQNRPFVSSILTSPIITYSKFEFNCLAFSLKAHVTPSNETSFSRISISLRDSSGSLRTIWSRLDANITRLTLIEVDLIMEPPSMMIVIEAEAFDWLDGEIILDNIKFYNHSCKYINKLLSGNKISTWSNWSECEASIQNQCGFNLLGVKKRFRTCLDENGCFSIKLVESQSCIVNVSCPNSLWLTSRWSPWSSWSTCSATCKTASNSSVRVRTRTCLNYDQCIGEATQVEECDVAECERATWSEWSEWSVCSVTCGNGWKQRTRFCHLNNMVVSNSMCSGSHVSTMPCNESECVSWSEWSEWSECSRTCDVGIQSRRRVCLSLEKNCVGSNRALRACNNIPCTKELFKSDVMLKCTFDLNSNDKCNIYYEKWKVGLSSYSSFSGYEVRYLYTSPSAQMFQKAYINTGQLRSHNGACLSFFIKNSGQNVGVFKIEKIRVNSSSEASQIYQEILRKNGDSHWKHVMIYLKPSDEFYLQFQLSISWGSKIQHFAIDDILIETKEESTCVAKRIIKRDINLHDENTIQYLKILPSSCGGIFYLKPSYVYFLNSPGYPSSYEIDKKCIYLLKAPNHYKIKIDFLAMNIEANTRQDLCNDYLEVRYFQLSQPGPRYCGEMIKYDEQFSITSYTNDTMLIFYSDWAVVGTGFKLKIKTIRKN